VEEEEEAQYSGLDLDALPEVHPPYLPEKDECAPKYTLVLDLDETLIHYSEKPAE